METIKATLAHVIYQKPPNMWGVFSFTNSDNDDFTATGLIFSPMVGSEYTMAGTWETHPKYGSQFKIESVDTEVELTKPGIIALLSSKHVPGVGPLTAKAIVDEFGLDTLDIIRSETNYHQLTRIPGIGAKTAENIHSKFPPIGDAEKLRLLLGSSATERFLNKIVMKYKSASVEVVKNDPYRLIEDFDGIGFIKADKIASAIGIAQDSPMRIRAAIYHFLSSEAEKNGHCFAYSSSLEAGVQKLIPGVDVKVIADVIQDMVTNKSYHKMALVVDSDGAIYLKSLYEAETTCANKICDLLQSAIIGPNHVVYTYADMEAAAAAVKAATGIYPEKGQLSAAEMALNRRISVITGGPGTGKTTIIRTILQCISTKEPHSDIALMAPTGRAAVRMQDVTGYNAMTIHSRLCLRASDSGDDTPTSWGGMPLNADTIIVDEASMIDIHLAAILLRNIKPTARVIFVGDVDQLPPVGPGAFFRGLIQSYKVPTARLTLSFRQHGSIASNAAKVNFGEGCHAFVQDDTFHFVKATKATAPDLAVQAYLDMLKKYGVNETILLSPSRQRGAACTNELNKRIQELVNPSDVRPELETRNGIFRLGDRVMLQRNRWKSGLANGDTGVITAIGKDVVVEFDNGITEKFSTSEFIDLFSLAYATTVHKAQGGEYKGVVFVFTSEHAFQGQRNLVYTAMTRAKSEISIIGDARSINNAIGTVTPLTRNSKLVERINAL